MRRRGPGAALGAAVVAASAALHLLVVGTADGLLEARTAAPPTIAPPLTVRQVEAPAMTAAPGPETDVPAAGADAAGTAPVPAAPGPATPAEPLHYFETHEVDTPAEPQPDWVIDTPGLASVGVKRLGFEIHVGGDGVPRRCEVLSMDPPLTDAWPLLAQRLCTTPMSPAVRRGAPVPSVRRIEMEISR